jgi:hypothetical protein
MITEGARCAGEIKCGFAMAKAAFSRKQALLTSKLELHVRKKPVKCYIWCCNWTPRKVDMIYLRSFEMWSWRRERSVGTTVWYMKGCQESSRRGIPQKQ